MNREKVILQKVKTGLARIYGDRLKGIYLFGSYARGEADDESDMDMLIILDRVDNYYKEINITGNMVAPLSLEYGVAISRVFISERELNESETLFIRNVRDKAIPV